jgi:phosphohistidine phosphatase SixA
MKRRTVLKGSGLWALEAMGAVRTIGAVGAALHANAAQAQQATPTPGWSRLPEWARAGGVMLIRHASTEPGIGDPAHFTLGQCKTQRNLSAQGQEESRRIGRWFKQQGLLVNAVRTSQWCRCQDTARLAFDRYEDWPALNSTFAGQGNPVQQIRELRERLSQLPQGVVEVWVTHQVIMTALTQAYPSMAEGFWVNRQGTLLGRGMMLPKV